MLEEPLPFSDVYGLLKPHQASFLNVIEIVVKWVFIKVTRVIEGFGVCIPCDQIFFSIFFSFLDRCTYLLFVIEKGFLFNPSSILVPLFSIVC
jgi:hypothetical protein